VNKGTPLRKTSCSECGSSDGKQIFQQDDGSLDAFCFACESVFNEVSEGVGMVGGRKSVTEPPRASEGYITVEQIGKLPSDGFRSIKKQVVDLFNVKVGYSKSDGSTIVKHYYPTTKEGLVTGYEERTVLDKGFRSVGDRKGDVELFGTGLAKRNGGKKLYITEGACDAMALYQAIVIHTDPKYKTFKPSVVSLTRGVTSAVKDILNNRAFVESYNEVILVLDNDDAGKKAVKDVLKTFHTFKVAELPLKDANAMLEAGRTQELYQKVVWDSQPVRQGEVLDVLDFIDKALIKPEMGISFPWPTVTKACFGIRPHNIHIVGAAPKIGKTDHQHQLVEHLIYKENAKVGMFDLENAPAKTAKKLAGKHDRVDYSRPDIEYDIEDLRNTLTDMNGKVRFYDRLASRDWNDIRIAIEEMHLLDDINIFIIDPLTALISRYASSEANDKLNEIMTDMADLVMKYPITIFCYSHVNPKPKTSTPHEAGGKVLSSEFTGSRAMEKWAHYGHGISRDRTEDCEPARKNMSEFRMLFDRDFGQGYSCDVYFDERTITYLEVKGY